MLDDEIMKTTAQYIDQPEIDAVITSLGMRCSLQKFNLSCYLWYDKSFFETTGAFQNIGCSP